MILVTQHVLINGINNYYPNVKTGTWRNDRFFVHLKEFGSTTYVIVDDDLELEAKIEGSKLENPDFDLVEWYVEYIELNCHYYKQYLKYQRNRYNPERYEEEILITGKINRLKGNAISRLRRKSPSNRYRRYWNAAHLSRVTSSIYSTPRTNRIYEIMNRDLLWMSSI